jgi:transposase
MTFETNTFLKPSREAKRGTTAYSLILIKNLQTKKNFENNRNFLEIFRSLLSIFILLKRVWNREYFYLKNEFISDQKRENLVFRSLGKNFSKSFEQIFNENLVFKWQISLWVTPLWISPVKNNSQVVFKTKN